MSKVDYNIEYAHIYSNEVFNHEHTESLDVLDLVLKILKKDNRTYSLNLLIDEYHPGINSLDVDDFLIKLKDKGYYPDFLHLESDLHKDIDFVLENLIKKKLVNEYYRYFEKNGKSPCSYLVAVWYLKRLGILPSNNIKKLTDKEKNFNGQQIINILSKKYKKSEDKALELIKHSKFRDHANKIIYYYY